MKVYVMSKPQFNEAEFARFCANEGIDIDLALASAGTHRPPEQIVEAAGRLCYMSYGKGRKTRNEFIANLIESGHHSVLEHANWTLFITGISRSCSHELVRHRHFSFSQLSQRYVDHKNVELVVPAAVEECGPAIEAHWHSLMREVVEFYDNLWGELGNLPRKEGRTAARSVLPNCTSTKIAVTGNARAWREFIQKRNIEAADPEIRALAQKVREVLGAESPMLFGDLP